MSGNLIFCRPKNGKITAENITKQHEDKNHTPRNSTKQMQDMNILANCILKDTR